MGPDLIITGTGRSGEVCYREGGRELRFYWEYGGDAAVVSVNVGTEEAWRSGHPWAADRRDRILRSVADEIVRQKAPTCVAEIDERSGWMHFRARAAAATPRARTAPDVAFVRRFSTLKALFGGAVLIGALILGGIVWLKNKVLVIDPGKGTPIGLAVRTDTHIATLIRTLEAYTPSLHRDRSKDTYAIGVFIVPLDGSTPRLVPISGGHSGNSLGLVKILGGNGRHLWFDVNGVGGVDLETFELTDVPAPRDLQGPGSFRLAPRIEASLSSGYFTGADGWFGLLSTEEAEREYAPRKWLRPITNAGGTPQLRRFHRGTVGESSGYESRRILSMVPIGDEGYLNAAFLRVDEKSEPLRLTDPDGALMIHASEPGLRGTWMVARVDTSGRVLWKVDTAIDRSGLLQILPGGASMAFIGTRLPVPDKVSEPLLVIVESTTGTMTSHSLWR